MSKPTAIEVTHTELWDARNRLYDVYWKLGGYALFNDAGVTEHSAEQMIRRLGIDEFNRRVGAVVTSVRAVLDL